MIMDRIRILCCTRRGQVAGDLEEDSDQERVNLERMDQEQTESWATMSREEIENSKITVFNESTCGICWDSWTEEGDHRLTLTECGHPFGLSCIMSCLQTPPPKCPVCQEITYVANIFTVPTPFALSAEPDPNKPPQFNDLHEYYEMLMMIKMEQKRFDSYTKAIANRYNDLIEAKKCAALASSSETLASLEASTSKEPSSSNAASPTKASTSGNEASPIKASTSSDAVSPSKASTSSNAASPNTSTSSDAASPSKVSTSSDAASPSKTYTSDNEGSNIKASMRSKASTISKMSTSTKISEKNVEPQWKLTYNEVYMNSVEKESKCLVYANIKNSLYYATKSISGTDWRIVKFDCEACVSQSIDMIHTAEIKDLQYTNKRRCLMTVGLDKNIQIYSNIAAKKVLTITTEVPLNCCSWNQIDNNLICVAGSKGSIFLYDIRRPKDYIRRFRHSNDKSSVLSVLNMAGKVLSISKSSVEIQDLTRGSYRHTINLDGQGNFYNFNYNMDTQYVIATRQSNSESKHLAFAYNIVPDEDFSVNAFPAEKVSAHNKNVTQFKVAGNKMFADFNDKGVVKVWDIVSKEMVGSFSSVNSIHDICGWKYGQDMFLGALSKHKMMIFKVGIQKS